MAFWLHHKSSSKDGGFQTYLILLSFCCVLSNAMGSKSVLLLLADGAEDMEVVITTDVLRRAKIDVTVVGVPDKSAKTCAMKTVMTPQVAITSLDDKIHDAVIIPGGSKGAETLAKHASVGSLLKRHFDAGKVIAAICAGPTVLKSHSIGSGMKVTSHPSVKTVMEQSGYTYSDDRVVTDSNLITSRGPGTAFEFAFEIIARLLDKTSADALKAPMFYKE